jgi:predicted AAA+ superfamily ATPase
MYLRRKIDQELELWMNEKNRKPLLLRGARQVGKSSTIRAFSKKFEYFIELNFDEQPDLASIFDDGLDPKLICEKISVLTQTPIIENKTLLFFDEIQCCVPAISSLRYFYEKIPNLHVIASGSLIEFVLSEVPSYGVGRVRSMFIYPFSFEEFLMANNEQLLLDALKKHEVGTELTEIFHNKLLIYLKKFLVIGGMPEAIKTYIQKESLLEVQRTLDDLIIAIEADFSKYKKNVAGDRIREVFNTVVHQTGHKFTYSYPNATLSNLQIKNVLDLLQQAGLVHYVTHSSCNGIPLGAESNPKKRKVLLFDTGIFQRILGLNIAELLIQNDFSAINKGSVAELFVGLELLKNESCYNKTELFYWQREAKSSQAEVDYVIQDNHQIIPIEVKSGVKGAMQSMYKFLEEKPASFGIRTSLENFGKIGKIQILPLYAFGIKLQKQLNPYF